MDNKYPHRILNGTHYIKVDDPVYKYELIRHVSVQTEIKGYRVHTEYADLYKDGRLVGRSGYRWDGPSGPTIDTPSTMRPSLFHDILWQMIEEGLLPESVRHDSNELLQKLGKEDGMLLVRTYAFYYATEYIGRPYIALKKWFWGRN